jgi:hypothetical protein
VFSNAWSLTQSGTNLAELERNPRAHTSAALLADGTLLELAPNGWGTVEVRADGEMLARIDRRSWSGRRWEISGTGFASELTSDPMPRRWTLRLGGEPIARMAGTLWSYNRLLVNADVAVPVHALILAWHVLARPWEQAAAPRSLVPDRDASP